MSQFSNAQNSVKVNRPNPLQKLTLIAMGVVALGGLAGLVWLVNLPYPMIRRPVAKTAPILLLPSYISMDRNYREAIAHVEQADQLVNLATSEADISLGEEKVQIAQSNLDALPVWFLGYEPVMYCNMFSCSWRFTFDEFQAARAQIGRMEAKVFQEKNAITQLKDAENTITLAKQDYQQATNPIQQQQAVGIWQGGIDQLSQLPSTTFAGKAGQVKLQAYSRDFQQVAGVVAGGSRTNTLIGAAKQYGLTAAQVTQNPPHSAAKWQQSANLWQDAIERLEQVPLEDTGYLQAQSLLAEYKKNLGEIQIRQQMEEESVESLETAQKEIQDLQANANTWERDRVMSEIEGIINSLEKVQPGTTSYTKAQELLTFAKNKRNQLES